MAKEKDIIVDGIPILLRKSVKSRRINITVKPIKGVSISVPSLVSFSKAQRVAENRIEWIKKSLKKMGQYENRITVFDEETRFKTKWHELLILKISPDEVKTSIKSGKMIISFPSSSDLKSRENQQIIKDFIVKTLRKEAKAYLPKRLAELASLHDLKYEKVSIRNAKTRWGSCSHVNNINLNLHLMRLPDHLIDYVILHELAHTVHKNHSASFWTFLDELTGDAKRLDKELKQYALEIY